MVKCEVKLFVDCFKITYEFWHPLTVNSSWARNLQLSPGSLDQLVGPSPIRQHRGQRLARPQRGHPPSHPGNHGDALLRRLRARPVSGRLLTRRKGTGSQEAGSDRGEEFHEQSDVVHVSSAGDHGPDDLHGQDGQLRIRAGVGETRGRLHRRGSQV